MMRRLLVFAAGLGSVAVLAWPSVATAAHWTRITDPTASNIDEVSLARTPDGFLHVAWTRPTPAHPSSGRDLVHLRISPAGAVGTREVLASDWAILENPALVSTGGSGLSVFVGAIRSTRSSETIQNLALFTSTNGGQSWSVHPSDVANGGSASDMSAALGSDGTPFEAWGTSSCLCVHRGISKSTPNGNFQSGLGNYGYAPGMALDRASGRLAVAWYSNGTGHTGVYAATVNQASGARSGSPMLMPGTATLKDGPFGGRTQIVARAGGGLFVAYEAGYPSHNKVLLWRVGSGSSVQMGRNRFGVTSVGVARTPTGRLWAFWSASSRSGTPLVYLRRSNPAATEWGGTVVLKPPAGATSSWNLVGDGQAKRLDLVGSFTVGTSSSSTASWYTQVLPGLSLTASRHRLKVGGHKPQKVTFTVDDAGAPLGDAKVKVGHVHGVTGADGQVTLRLGPFSHRTHLKARATHAGYSAASLRLKVK